MIKYKVYIKAAIFILIIAGLLGFTNHRNTLRKVSAIQVEFEKGDNLFITANMVNKLLTQSITNIKNQSKENIILETLEQQISANEMIENAEVYLTVDGVLKTKVLQRKPIARIQVNNSAYYLDRKGKKMPLSKDYSARVPIVSGVKSDKDLELVYKMCTTVLNDPFMEKQIIGARLVDNEFEFKTRVGDQLIEFGSLTKAKEKINKLKAFYKKEMNGSLLKKYSKINVKYNGQVVCTKTI